MSHHIHDCNKCKYIGSFLDPVENSIMDVYRTCEGSHYDYIVRYGDDGPDYITVLENSHFYPVCNALHTHMLAR
jgi:hypothetical protein